MKSKIKILTMEKLFILTILIITLNSSLSYRIKNRKFAMKSHSHSHNKLRKSKIYNHDLLYINKLKGDKLSLNSIISMDYPKSSVDFSLNDDDEYSNKNNLNNSNSNKKADEKPKNSVYFLETNLNNSGKNLNLNKIASLKANKVAYVDPSSSNDVINASAKSAKHNKQRQYYPSANFSPRTIDNKKVADCIEREKQTKDPFLSTINCVSNDSIEGNNNFVTDKKFRTNVKNNMEN